MAERIVYRVEFFKEGDLYVGLSHELNVSSFGETLEEARQSLQEAVKAFAETCQTMGTFEGVGETSPSISAPTRSVRYAESCLRRWNATTRSFDEIPIGSCKLWES